MKKRKVNNVVVLLSIFLIIFIAVSALSLFFSYRNGSSPEMFEMYEVPCKDGDYPRGSSDSRKAVSSMLPEDINNSCDLVFFSRGGAVRVYADGRLIYSLTESPNNTIGGFLVPCWNRVNLTEDMAENELRIEYEGGHYPDLVYVGNETDIFLSIIKNDALLLIICGTLMLIGIVCFVVSLFIYKTFSNPAALSYFSLFLMLFSVRTISDRLSVFICFDPKMLTLASCLSLSLLPLPFLAFQKIRAKGIWKHVCNVLLCVTAAVALTVNVLYFTGFAEFRETVAAVYVMIFASELYILIEKVHVLAGEKSCSALVELIGMLSLFGGSVFGAVSFYTHKSAGCLSSSAVPLVGVSLFSICIGVNLLRDIKNVIVQSREQSIMLEEAKTQLVLSQIKPHFIYNSLGAIRVLIKKDPDQAYDILYKFSKYLRQNIDVLENQSPIPFKAELEHIQTYIELEKLRFPGKFDVEFAVSFANFSVLPLSIQFFAENALKHGIFHKSGKGTLVIRTYVSTKYVYIEIEDDGVGFDTKKIEEEQESGHHVGMKNAIYRIEKIQNGKCEINSTPGEGTKVLIRIPKTDSGDSRGAGTL